MAAAWSMPVRATTLAASSPRIAAWEWRISTSGISWRTPDGRQIQMWLYKHTVHDTWKAVSLPWLFNVLDDQAQHDKHVGEQIEAMVSEYLTAISRKA